MSASSQPLSPLERHAKPEPPPVPDHPLVADVMQGRRYVTYPYVVSLLVVSLRRSMGEARLVDSENWPMGPLFAAAFVTLIFGWWGFPWGIIWTPTALVSLWRGGSDHTGKILASVVGDPEAKRILSLAKRPKPPAAIWLVRAMLLLPILLIVTLWVVA